MPDAGGRFESAVEEARSNGICAYETADGVVYIVNPAIHRGDPSSPFFGADQLLVPPLKRAAYSDRTAWLMAVLSQLAYEPFGTDEDAGEARGAIQAKLAAGGFILLALFDSRQSGTQAFLVKHETCGFAALVFRGTETNMKDILVDMNARFLDHDSGKMHRGFADAFQSVAEDVQSSILKLPDEVPLYIAGHSLGGALATVAAQEISQYRLVAACYTFGSPRVGTEEWSESVKAPIYRVVNGADGVPTVPGHVGLRWVLTSLPKIPFLSWLEGPITRLVSAGYVGYQHAGDQRFLLGLPESAKLKTGTPAFLYRLRACTVAPITGFFKGGFNYRSFSGFFTDHSISHYAAKLRKIAESRN